MKRIGPDSARRALPDPVQPLVGRLAEAGETLGVGVLLVGGPVRDLLLGRTPRDVDLIVEPPDGAKKPGAREVARAAAGRGDRVVAHDRFGTVQFRTREAVVDLATVRSEQYETMGALPTVGVGTLVEDQRRRDFSVNALAVPLNAPARRGRGRGGVIEADAGLADLREGVLRVFHPRSFHDDPTRAMRGARLAPRLGFVLSRSSRAALRSALRDGAFGAVSGERYRAEVEKLFGDAAHGLDPARALRLLADWHVLAALEPGLELPRDSQAPLRRLGRLLAAPPAALGRIKPLDAGLAVWLAPLAAPLRRRALARIAVQGESARRIGAFPVLRDRILRRVEKARGRGATDAVLAPLPPEELLALAAWAPPAPRRRILRHAEVDRATRIPIDGEDLLALGLQGPTIGRALAGVRVACLDGRVRTRDDAIALAREFAPRGGSGRPKANRQPKAKDGRRARAAKGSRAKRKPPQGPGG